MERRLILFLVLSFALLTGYSTLMQQLHPQTPDNAGDVGGP